MKAKKMISLGLAAAMAMSLAACGGGGGNAEKSDAGSSAGTESSAGSSAGTESSAGSSTAGEGSEGVPTIDQIKVGEDYQDLTASIKVLTNRTDIVDTVYKGYADEFMKLYPNITVEYEGITDYEESLNLRLTTGDWGDLCFIPTSVAKSELSQYFTPLGSFETLDPIYNFCQEKNFEGTVYGIANGGTASGVVYNKRIWNEAGITALLTTPDEFLEDLQKIKDNTDAVSLYTIFSAGWTMGACVALMKSRLTIQERLKDLRKEKDINLEKLEELTGISKSALGSYEANDYKEISHGNLVTLADFYGVSVDYLLCRTENRKLSNVPLAELHLSDDMVELLKSGNINNRLLCEIATNDKFVRLMTDTEIYIDGHATARFRDINESLEEQRLALINQHRHAEGDLYSETLRAGQIGEEDFFCHITHKTWDSILRDIRNAHEHDIDSTPDSSAAKKMALEIQRALSSPGDYLAKMWKVILSMLGIDYDKLTDDEQKVLKKVLAKSPAIKNSPLNFRRKRK